MARGSGIPALRHLERRADALAEAWRLRRERPVQELENFLQGLEPQLVRGEPELAYLYATLLHRAGRRAEAEPYLALLESGAQERAAPRLLLLAHMARAMVCQTSGDLAGAEGALLRAWSSACVQADDATMGQVSVGLAVVQALRGDYQRALQGFRNGYLLLQRAGDLDGCVLCQQNSAMAYLDSGRAAAAVPLVEDGLALALEIGRHEQLLRATQAAVWLELGDLPFAEATLRSALAGPWTSGRRGEAVRLLALILQRSGQPDAALQQVGEALAIGHATGDRLLQAQAGELHARLLRSRGEAEPAAAALAEAVAVYRAIGSDARAEAALRSAGAPSSP